MAFDPLLELDICKPAFEEAHSITDLFNLCYNAAFRAKIVPEPMQRSMRNVVFALYYLSRSQDECSQLNQFVRSNKVAAKSYTGNGPKPVFVNYPEFMDKAIARSFLGLLGTERFRMIVAAIIVRFPNDIYSDDEQRLAGYLNAKRIIDEAHISRRAQIYVEFENLDPDSFYD